MDDLMQWSLGERLAHLDQKIPQAVFNKFEDGIQRIALEDYPYQYISNTAWFYGLPLTVTEDVLIPRQETEGIVETIIQGIEAGEFPSNARVLDIGTGSGAIAIALKYMIPTLEITATDISPEALEVAMENAAAHHLTIRFLEGDLVAPVEGETFDIIVTNPPYIGSGEKDEVGTDVLKYEPHLALFAENEGFAIYDRLIPKLERLLSAKGFFMAECGYKQAETLATQLENYYPHNLVRIIKDYSDIERFVTMKK